MEITQAEEDPLGEVVLHAVELLEKNVPQICKRFRQALFANPFGIPLAGSPYSWLFGILVMAENSIPLIKAHLEKSSMDRLRACQSIYAVLNDKRSTVGMITEDDIDPSKLVELAIEANTACLQMVNKLMESLTRSDFEFIGEMIASIKAFFEVADMLGGDEVFMPKPDPAAVAQLQSLFTVAETGTRLNVPKVCKIHPPNMTLE